MEDEESNFKEIRRKNSSGKYNIYRYKDSITDGKNFIG